MEEMLRCLGRGVVAGWLAAVLALAIVLIRATLVPEVAATTSGLAFPVPDAERRDLLGSFDEARGERTHAAVDIRALRGARVVAVRAGTIARLGSGGNAGLSIDLLGGDGRHCYFYAHLGGLAPGLREGLRVERGATLGSVGTSGNAAPDAPHLHFAIRRLDPGQGCWDGEPLDPAPLLRVDP
jgi:murein DD-endopeptidase MepM/ murein hydrolase activator NlpD